MCLFRKHDVTVSFSTLFSSHFCSDAGFGQQGNKCWPMFSVLNERIKVIFYCRFFLWGLVCLAYIWGYHGPGQEPSPARK